ncbi:MAG: sialidase family protein [Thermoplasmatota archaeon]
MRRLGAFIALLLAAGCASPAAGPASPPTPLPAAAITGCQTGCWEPDITADGSRLFVVAAEEPLMAVSDGGAPFQPLMPPPAPAGSPPGMSTFDGFVQAGPSGKLYYLAFLAPVTAILAGPVGLQVAFSTDGGRTWASNLFLSVAADPQAHVLPPWKSWIGFGSGDRVYVDYNQRGTGLWMGRSDDAGRSFHPFVHVNPATDKVLSIAMGPPLVDGAGRVYVPYMTDQSTGNETTPNPQNGATDLLSPYYLPKSHTLRVAISGDEGATFRHVVVRTAPDPDWVGSLFPIMAMDEHEHLFLAFRDRDARAVVTASFDHGASWSTPVAWGASMDTSAPWITAAHGNVTVAFFARVGALSDFDVVGATGSWTSLTAPSFHGSFARGMQASGDFASFVDTLRGPIGVWSANQTVYVGRAVAAP